MGDVREIQISVEGWEMFRGWAQTLAEAEASGEDVPTLQDVDAVVAWLHDHDEIERSITTEEARLLIEACLKGGLVSVRVA